MEVVNTKKISYANTCSKRWCDGNWASVRRFWYWNLLGRVFVLLHWCLLWIDTFREGVETWNILEIRCLQVCPQPLLWVVSVKENDTQGSGLHLFLEWKRQIFAICAEEYRSPLRQELYKMTHNQNSPNLWDIWERREAFSWWAVLWHSPTSHTWGALLLSYVFPER